MSEIDNELLLYYAVRNYLIYQKHLLKMNVYDISARLVKVFGCVVPIPIIKLAISEAKEYN